MFECGHVGLVWTAPVLPWRKPHWHCRHCRRRFEAKPTGWGGGTR